MIIPVRCMTCGNPIGHLWKGFQEAEDSKAFLDEAGLTRYCCRAHLLGHVDLIDTAAKFKRF